MRNPKAGPTTYLLLRGEGNLEDAASPTRSASCFRESVLPAARDLAISSAFVVRSPCSHLEGGLRMLRQDDPVAGGVPPPRALPVGYVVVRLVRHLRRRVRRFRRTHNGVGWALVTGVIAVGVGFYIGHL